MSHRLGAIIVTILTVLYVAIGRPKEWPIILLLLGLQIALGIGNVLLGLPFAVDVAHLAIGTALFGALVISVGHLSQRIAYKCPTLIEGRARDVVSQVR